MVLYQVYSQEHRIRYLAHPCSTAVLFQIICLIFTFLPPLFIGYFTSGFYYKELIYSEQPNISFLEKYNVIIDSTVTNVFSSSDTRLNNYFQSIYNPSTLDSFIPRDVDGDGIIDQYMITLEVIQPVSLSGGENIQVWLLFQYALNQYPLINMETLGLISLKVPSGLATSATVTIYGQLLFQQNKPIVSYENDSSIQGSIVDYGTYLTVPSFDEILRNYTSRNYYTLFDQQYVQWSSTSSSSSTGSTLLTLKIIVNIGQQSIRYVPSFWKEFRWSWIQYVAGLLPFFYVVNKVKEFVFSNGLVRTVVGKSP